MKKILFGAAVIAVVGLFSCKSTDSDPKAVLTSFFDALSKKDVATARKYATESSKSMLDFMELSMSKDSGKNVKNSEYDKDKVDFGEPKIEGDKATIYVKEKGKEEGTNFTLKKEKGAWKVAFDKEMMSEKMAEGMGKMKDSNPMDTISDFKNMDTSMNRMPDTTMPR